MSKLSRREREKMNRRNEILQAAWEVFASKDYDSATIDDVATAAELSKGTVYLYFQSKADLFHSTIEMGMEKVNTMIQEIVSSSEDPVSGLREIIKRLLDYSEENMDFFKILSSGRAHFEIHAEMANNRDLKERIMKTASRSVAIVAEHIQRGIEVGVLKQVNPEDAAFVLLSVVRGFAFRRIIGPDEFSLPGKAEIITDILLDGLRKPA